MHSSSPSTTKKPKRYYDSVSQQMAENSQTVRGVIKQNKISRSKAESEAPNLQSNPSVPLNKQPSDNVSHASSSSSINNDSFYDEDDALSDYRMYPSCYNRQKIIVAPLGKTTINDTNQKKPPISSSPSKPNHPNKK